jgi:hypothetical protein
VVVVDERLVVEVVDDDVTDGRVVAVVGGGFTAVGRPWQAPLPASVKVFPASGRNRQS